MSLQKIKEVQRVSYVVRTEPPSRPPVASPDIDYAYPRLVDQQQLRLQNPQQAQVPFQLQSQPQMIQRQPGPQPVVVGRTDGHMNADPRFLQPNEMFPEVGPVRIGRVDEVFDQAIPLGPVEEGDWNVVQQAPPPQQQQYQQYPQYQLQPVQLGAPGGTYGLPVFLQGPQPLNKVPQRNDPSSIEQRQMPSSYRPF